MHCVTTTVHRGKRSYSHCLPEGARSWGRGYRTIVNIALTNGSQSRFFYLFNLFAGRFKADRALFPLRTEILVGADADWNRSGLSLRVRILERNYVDLYLYIRRNRDDLRLRPTNPTGLMDEELLKLDALANTAFRW